MKQFIALLAILLLACAPVPTDNPPFDPTESKDVTAQGFSSIDELSVFVQEHESGSYYGGFGLARAETAAMDSSAGAPMPTANGVKFSETNVQVQGIDEADLIKTDGEFIYTFTENTVFIVKAGEDAEVVHTIELEHQPQGLFLEDKKLAVFGNFYDKDYFREHDLEPYSGMTYLNIYDVSGEPELLEEYIFEGYYLDARMSDGRVYFISISGLHARPYPMPIIVRNDVVSRVPVEKMFYYDIPYDNTQFATVHTIEMADQSLIDSTTVAIEASSTVYMSPEAIYLVGTKYINEWEIRREIVLDTVQLDADERERISRINAIDNDILNAAEKKQKIYTIYEQHVELLPDDELEELQESIEKKLKDELEQYQSREYTIIHKLNADPVVSLGASVQVPGSVINQFSMDEFEGYFRIATTLSPWNFGGGSAGGSVGVAVEPPVMAEVADSDNMGEATVERIMPAPRSDTINNVYILDENLEIVGELDGLAEGERIFSARFMGEKLYLVTFRQVDPFFVIDLSDPRKPEMLGELKIPGFSRYLHPYDDNTIIGIGRDATETGRQQGLKISLFDVTDVQKPKEIAQFVAEGKYSSSTAEWEHHAFLFDREKNLLVIPAYSYDYERDTQDYNGAMVFDITRSDIELKGIVDHSQEQRYGAAVQRSLYIGDLLYTKSPYLLRVNDIETLNGVADVELNPKSRTDYPVY